MRVIAYHATRPECAEKIRHEGFRLDAKRMADPGDFGWGTYFTKNIHRARAISRETILRCQITLKNPIVFKTMGEAYAFMDGLYELYGSTIHGYQDEREAASQRIRQFLLGYGWDGIVVHEPKRGGRYYEIVVFNPETVKVL